MTQQITTEILKKVVDRINRELGTPATAYTQTGDTRKANTGHFMLEYAYGGVKLVQIVNEYGAERNVFGGSSYVPKRRAFEMMWAFIAGVEAARGELA